MVCFRCNQPGHRAWECPQQPNPNMIDIGDNRRRPPPVVVPQPLNNVAGNRQVNFALFAEEKKAETRRDPNQEIQGAAESHRPLY